MDFEWDEQKLLSNIEKHGFDFVDVVEIFEGNHLTAPASTKQGEQRHLAVGIIGGLYAAVIYTIRNGTVRVISVRRARHEERRHYQAIFSG